MKKNVNIVVIVLALMVWAVVKGIVKKANTPGANSVEKELAAVVLELKLPSAIAEGMRLDVATAGPGRQLTFISTFVNHTRDELDTNHFMAQMAPHLNEAYKSKPSFTYYRENEVVLNYSYRDKNSNSVLTITIPSYGSPPAAVR